ncbi:EcsC family protein [Geomicrobium sp. JCM 19038]|uniref:EcsC family protein n=1 Tax=Geomicrobium sp. JCM 19038 TaxID=1460635 RepID=UPI00045F2EB1|nr:EcsC family protein [Geomicrobium sp. JCM 19038]GAK06322.1 EcsC protein [Geomicrobium sp. JCM 19038]
MEAYEKEALMELNAWKRKLAKNPSMVKDWTKSFQSKMNGYVPDKVHVTIGNAIRQMIDTTMNTSEYVQKKEPLQHMSLEQRDEALQKAIVSYRRTASLEGAGTGAGGILLGMSDFPMLLAIKMRFLFTTAQIYGYDPKHVDERLFVLNVFQMAFSSRKTQRETLARMEQWQTFIDEFGEELTIDQAIDWVTFQLEYRDFIDVPKTLQLIPGFGLFVGATINYQLLIQLGEAAQYCYRIRWFQDQLKQ